MSVCNGQFDQCSWKISRFCQIKNWLSNTWYESAEYSRSQVILACINGGKIVDCCFCIVAGCLGRSPLLPDDSGGAKRGAAALGVHGVVGGRLPLRQEVVLLLQEVRHPLCLQYPWRLFVAFRSGQQYWGGCLSGEPSQSECLFPQQCWLRWKLTGYIYHLSRTFCRWVEIATSVR